MMNRFFTLLLAATCLTAVGQVPDYVPTDGLVIWSSLEGTSGEEVSGASLVQGRFGESNSAYSFDGDDWLELEISEIPVGNSPRSISFWYNQSSVNDNSNGASTAFFYGTISTGMRWASLIWPDTPTLIGESNDACFGCSGSTTVELISTPLNEWHHVVYTFDGAILSCFINGQLGYTSQKTYSTTETKLTLGKSEDAHKEGEYFSGSLDDIGIWDRALSSEEIASLFNASGPLGGCTNESACNFDLEAVVDDGSCTLADCTDPQACNFNSEAACDDGNCVYPPVVELGEDIDTCEEFVVLDAGDNHDSYLWNTGDTTQFLEVSESGEYSVDVTHWSTQSEYSLDFGLQANCGFGNTWVDCGHVFESNGSFSVGGWLFNNGCDYTTIVSQRPGGSCTDPYYGPGPYNGFHLSYENDGQFEFRLHQNSNGNDPIEPAATTSAIEEAWVHLVGVFESGQSVKLFLNGALVDSQPTSIEALEFCDYPFLIGSLQHGGNWSWDGKLDDVFAYGRALSDAEVLAIFESSYPSDDLSGLWRFEEGEGGYSYDASGNGHHGVITGATWSADVPESIAFVECSASDTIGVQLFSYACLCGEGTTWDESLGECVAVLSSQNACGGGTQWDDETQTCIVANPADINLDGCVQLNDLLDLLSAYGDCGAEESAWQCGDPLEYQGYDYETVQIGEQCWFAENLRAENYRNGDAIPANLSDSAWMNTNLGALAVYGEGSSYCETYSPDGDACDEEWSLNEYGRLYNWYAVDDSRGLCPSGWMVPSPESWTMLKSFLSDGNAAGIAMKSTYGWFEDGDGTNESGFGALPSGDRKALNGHFVGSGVDGNWWSSSSTQPRFETLSFDDIDMTSLFTYSHSGFSIRCIKDTE